LIEVGGEYGRQTTKRDRENPGPVDCDPSALWEYERERILRALGFDEDIRL